MNILIVDDEEEIADLVELYLSNENYTIYKFYNATDALACIASQPIDLAILDVMLPGANGFDICRIIRQHYTYPIMMLTAKVEAIDKINGLTVGADDYITKPFNPLELVARVKAQLRRYTRYNNNEQRPVDILDFNGLSINHATHQCTLFENNLQLTPPSFLFCGI